MSNSRHPSSPVARSSPSPGRILLRKFLLRRLLLRKDVLDKLVDLFARRDRALAFKPVFVLEPVVDASQELGVGLRSRVLVDQTLGPPPLPVRHALRVADKPLDMSLVAGLHWASFLL
jgi:hypothetical protein